MPMEKQDIIDAIRNVLDDDEWNYDLETDREDGPIIRTGCRIGGKLRNISEVIDFGDTFFLVFALCPIHADPENLVELSKYLHMANYGLVLGNFELDHRDGEIRYKAMVDCNGLDAIPSAIIDRAIHVPFRMFARYGDGIAALAMGFSDAETEYKKTLSRKRPPADDEPSDDDE